MHGAVSGQESESVFEVMYSDLFQTDSFADTFPCTVVDVLDRLPFVANYSGEFNRRVDIINPINRL